MRWSMANCVRVPECIVVTLLATLLSNKEKKMQLLECKAGKLNIIFSSPSYSLREHFYVLCIIIKSCVVPAPGKLTKCDTYYISFQLLH